MVGMTTPQAIIVAALVIAMSVLGTAVVTPYRISSDPTGVWRINTLTGDVRLCSYGAALGDNRC